MLWIASDLLDQIRVHAAAAPGREVCGLLLGRDDRVEAVVACDNVADDPARRFEIDPAALLAAHRAARAGAPPIVGHYHSHPSGRAVPSPRDAADAAPDGTIWLIVGGGGDVRAWRAVAAGEVERRFDPVALATA
ncbi:M67 family metallopeptidase [Sphingomonas beigongshangi]|uniref:M67 family metallopeptidase n=1 Tax=Sphingomonas beigongshangi TaxID=2782540 RepID=UPI001AEDFED8|nr:M67 family metallopeptidase [Sphingomonas beigongshangi]